MIHTKNQSSRPVNIVKLRCRLSLDVVEDKRGSHTITAAQTQRIYMMRR